MLLSFNVGDFAIESYQTQLKDVSQIAVLGNHDEASTQPAKRCVSGPPLARKQTHRWREPRGSSQSDGEKEVKPPFVAEKRTCRIDVT